jgi:Zn-dependent protease
MNMNEKKKIYTSFHDIPVREYMYFPKGTLDVGKPGKFSRTEIIHIIISILVLTIAFSFWLSGGLIFNSDINLIIRSFPYAFAGVLTAFFFHEMSHKFMAQKFGLWAEYRLFPLGLILALIISVFTGLIFAAPGAVMFMGGSRYHETGKIAIAGPFSNIIIAFVTFLFYKFVFFETQIGTIFGFICLINAFLAFFNLLPIGPLDGVKVVRWNATIWVILFIVSILILILTWIIFPLSIFKY